MAKGFGRTLDWTTLMACLRNDLNVNEESRFCMVFDKDRGFTAFFGMREPDEVKWFETWDSALFALHIGPDNVPGVEDYGG